MIENTTTKDQEILKSGSCQAIKIFKEYTLNLKTKKQTAVAYRNAFNSSNHLLLNKQISEDQGRTFLITLNDFTREYTHWKNIFRRSQVIVDYTSKLEEKMNDLLADSSDIKDLKP